MISILSGIVNPFKGYKTYLSIGLGAAVIIANHFSPGLVSGVDLDPNNWVMDLITCAAGAAFRSAIG